MNFTIDRDLFMKNLNNASKALSTKTPMPILTGIKLEALGDSLVITTSNSDISMRVEISGEGLTIDAPGTIVVPGKYLLEIVKKVGSKSIQMFSSDDNLIKIISGKSDFTLNGMETENYPQINFVETSDPISLLLLDFKNLIKQTTFATSFLENRPILTGLNFDFEGNKMRCVATDSYRLAQKEITLEKEYDKLNIIVPGKALDELNKILDDMKEHVLLFVEENKILFKYKNILFQSRLLEGTYPKTTGLIPTEFSVQIKFNKQELMTTIDRAALLNQGSSSIVKLNIRPDKIVEISSTSSEIGKAVEEIAPIDDVVGPALKISFSAKYFLEALRVFDSSEVEVNFTGEIRPFIIKGDLDKDLIQLILPVRTE